MFGRGHLLQPLGQGARVQPQGGQGVRSIGVGGGGGVCERVAVCVQPPLTAQGAAREDVLLLDVGRLLDPPADVTAPVQFSSWTAEGDRETVDMSVPGWRGTGVVRVFVIDGPKTGIELKHFIVRSSEVLLVWLRHWYGKFALAVRLKWVLILISVVAVLSFFVLFCPPPSMVMVWSGLT